MRIMITSLGCGMCYVYQLMTDYGRRKWELSSTFLALWQELIPDTPSPSYYILAKSQSQILYIPILNLILRHLHPISPFKLLSQIHR